MVADHECERCPQGFSFKHPRKNLDLIGLSPRGRQIRLARTTPAQCRLNPLHVQLEIGRTPLNHHPDRAPMALTKGRDTERSPKAAAWHGHTPLSLPVNPFPREKD